MCDCVVLCADDPKDRRKPSAEPQIESTPQLRDTQTEVEELSRAGIEIDVTKIDRHLYSFVNNGNFSNYKEFYDFMLENSAVESSLCKRRKRLIELLKRDRDSNK